MSALPSHPGALPRRTARAFAPEAPRRLVLAGGGVLVARADRSLPLVEGLLVFDRGSSGDPAARAGRTELAADALRAGGSRARDGGALDLWLDERAAEIELSTERDAVRIGFSCLAEHAEELIAAVGELLAEPAYPEPMVEQARARLLAALRRRGDTAAQLAERAGPKLAYGFDSPWAREPSEAGVSALGVEDGRAWHAETFARAGLVVGLAGDVDPERAAGWIERALGGLARERATPIVTPPVFAAPPRLRACAVDKPGVNQCELRLLGPGIERAHADWPALELWSHAVGLSMSSRLFARVRTALGLAYSVGAAFRPEWRFPGRFQAWCGTATANAERALSESLALLEAAASSELPAAELDEARERLVASEIFRIDSAEKQVERAVALERHGYPADHFERVRAAQASLGPADVARAARAHFDRSRLIAIAAGPLAELEPALARFGAVERIELEAPQQP